jgi:hypothetical protein
MAKTAKRARLLVGMGIGYVLGARAGRGRYEQMRDGARRLLSRTGIVDPPPGEGLTVEVTEVVAWEEPVLFDAPDTTAGGEGGEAAGAALDAEDLAGTPPVGTL